MQLESRAEELVRAARTTLGDRVRSVTYFTRDEFRQLYLRSDLSADADLVGFVRQARTGFDSRTDYAGSELGAFHYTVRTFEEGCLIELTDGDAGVFVTLETVSFRRADETAAALSSVLDQ
jgi:hypothetical protein